MSIRFVLPEKHAQNEELSPPSILSRNFRARSSSLQQLLLSSKMKIQYFRPLGLENLRVSVLCTLLASFYWGYESMMLLKFPFEDYTICGVLAWAITKQWNPRLWYVPMGKSRFRVPWLLILLIVNRNSRCWCRTCKCTPSRCGSVGKERWGHRHLSLWKFGFSSIELNTEDSRDYVYFTSQIHKMGRILVVWWSSRRSITSLLNRELLKAISTAWSERWVI